MSFRKQFYLLKTNIHFQHLCVRRRGTTLNNCRFKSAKDLKKLSRREKLISGREENIFDEKNKIDEKNQVLKSEVCPKFAVSEFVNLTHQSRFKNNIDDF